MTVPEDRSPTPNLPEEITTVSASGDLAGCSAIVLRENTTTKLWFAPQIFNNEKHPAACVRGWLIFERKSPTGQFMVCPFESFSRFKAGEGYKLELHAEELYTFGQGVERLYALHKQEGVPRGTHRFLRIEARLSELLGLNSSEQRELLSRRPTEVANALSILLKWVSESPAALSQFTTLSKSEFPSITSVLGLAAVKNALNFWEENKEDGREEFWQGALTERAYILSQAFAYPVILVKGKAYVGGKQFDDKHGKIADFLMAAESTSAALIVELKNPKTPLLGDQYRDGVYPPSYELSSAIAQVLNYQRHWSMDFNSVMAKGSTKLTLGQTRCLVVAGNSAELSGDGMKESFELLRDRLQGVTVVTYDELFLKLKRFVQIVEPSVI
jgi:antiviral defense system Shedu protein SduA